jgi:tetratricopeptide (TPR) repeat protein
LGRIHTVLFAMALAASPSAAQAPSLDFLEVPARPDDDRPRVPASDAAALSAMDGEYVRFATSARAFRANIDAIARRRLADRRRELAVRYARQLEIERAAENDAQGAAIRELSRFLERHATPRPGDVHRPEMMLRLAELFVLRALDEAGEERPRFDPAIALATQLAREHPDFAAMDRVHYLLGYTLWEMDRHAEALAAWRSLACPNIPAIAPADHAAHPALRAPQRGVPDIRDPYEACAPASQSPLLSEVWLRIGEHHFERGELGAALGAYQRVAASENDPLYGFGLYKLAWTYYRASRFADAIDRFGALVEWSDRRLELTGRAGSDLRAEALQYIAIALAYDDWNEDGAADAIEPTQRALTVLPDRPWSREAMRALGAQLFDEARYPDAVAAWRDTLRRAPRACDHADVLLSIVRAHRRHGEEDSAFAALAEIVDVELPASRCSAADRARARHIAEEAILAIAFTEHRRAQRLRALGNDRDARRAYDDAVRAYRAFLARFADHPRAYQAQYDLADALYWSGRPLLAANAYAAVRDSQIDDRYFGAAARRVVESYQRVLETELEANRTTLRTEPPADHNPIAVPIHLQQVARAREIYIRWVDPTEDYEHVRDAYAFNNALLLYQYGYWPQARERLARIFEESCAAASESALSAWRVLHDMAAATQNIDEAARLNESLRACTMNRRGAPAVAEACVEPGSPACILLDSEPRVALARLRADIEALRRQPDSPSRRERAETIASNLIGVAERAPQHPQARLALSTAAHVQDELAHVPGAAERTYQRIIDAASDTGADNLAIDARFSLARIAHRRFDIERALEEYEALASMPRSDDPEIAELQQSASVNAALLASTAGRHAQAAQAWRRAADRLSGEEASRAELESARELLAAGRARESARALDAWLAEHRGEDALAVRAHIARADAAAQLRDHTARTRSLENAVRSHRVSGAAPELAAPAALELADANASSFGTEPIRIPVRPTTEEAIAELRQRIRTETARYRPLLEAYDAVIALGRPAESEAALERQGALLESLIRTTLEAQVELPHNLARAVRGSPTVRASAQAAFTQAIRDRLDEEVRPVECRAIEHYLLALRLAQREGHDAPLAMQRLTAYGEERVAECSRSAAERDASFAPLAPGELTRARQGVHTPPDNGTAPPAIAR